MFSLTHQLEWGDRFPLHWWSSPPSFWALKPQTCWLHLLYLFVVVVEINMIWFDMVCFILKGCTLPFPFSLPYVHWYSTAKSLADPVWVDTLTGDTSGAFWQCWDFSFFFFNVLGNLCLVEYFFVKSMLFSNQSYAVIRLDYFSLKWIHIFNEHVFVGWAAELRMWLAHMKSLPNLLYQCQTAYYEALLEWRNNPPNKKHLYYLSYVQFVYLSYILKHLRKSFSELTKWSVSFVWTVMSFWM